MVIAQKTYKHKVLLLMKVGLAVFMVVIFLAQNAASGTIEAKNFVYKKLNAVETEYFLSNLNALPESGGTESAYNQAQGLNFETISAQISAQIKNAVEPLLLKEASSEKTIAPSFAEHQSASNILSYSFILTILALLFIQKKKIISRLSQSLKLKKITASISPRSPNFNI